MAFFQCSCFSEILGLTVSFNVLLPQETRRQIGLKGRKIKSKYPVLFLLHGLSDDHTIWMRRTSIERYADPLGLAVVMPAVGRSYYTDMKRGYAYWTFISEEMPELVRSFFPLSDRREDNFAAGLSMGGYGAFKLAFRNPERFAAAASLSGVLDLAAHVSDSKSDLPDHDFNLIFGEKADITGTRDDLFFLLTDSVLKKRNIPVLYQSCGTRDSLYNENCRFRDVAKDQNVQLYYEEEVVEHTWNYWDRQIEKVLKWLPLGI